MKQALLALGVLLLSAVVAHAQLPTEPVSVAGGRVVIAAEVSATIASNDPGFFNYTDYEYSALRNLRIGVGAEFRASRWLQVLGELRVDHGTRIEPFALYARIRPWPTRRFDIQAGRIPATFGAFGRNVYGNGNLVIGTPLAYQYLTSLRPDSLPATAADLLRMRGRGWLSNFPLGVTSADRGLPLINSLRADTGVQVHGVNGIVEWTAAVTTGSLSNPRVRDDNGGRQLVGRMVARPVPAVALGVSAARGAYLSRDLQDALPSGSRIEDGVQRAMGLDAEYSEGRFLARAEVIRSHWTLPFALSGRDHERLGASGVLVEARYRVFPGVQLAARAERLDFTRIQAGGLIELWEAPVRRVEIGASYSFIRNVTLKASVQRNTRDGGRVRRDMLGALQVVYWF
ncbi:MAG TPA: hypothetical protein VMO26_28670 [Vicinamibacterales bacterium]|nr:hypothetical protein [Vicinamibacterales bacterium]